MKNQYGFIPARYKQPHSYRLIFGGWCAIYKYPKTGVEYHLQLMPKLHISRENASHIQVLRQDKDCRRQISEQLTTIKAAVDIIERIFDKSDDVAA